MAKAARLNIGDLDPRSGRDQVIGGPRDTDSGTRHYLSAPMEMLQKRVEAGGPPNDRRQIHPNHPRTQVTASSAARRGRSRRTSRWWALLAGLLTAAFLPSIAPAAPIASAAAGTTAYVAVGPERLVDTRINQGFQRVKGTTLLVPAAGVGSIPGGAQAVSLTITATNTAGGGFLTVWPAGEAMPLVATVNFDQGQTVSNGAIVKLGANGALNVYSSVPADVVVDVSGAFTAATAATAGRFVATDPVRVADTRSGNPVAGGATLRVALPGSVPADAIGAVVTLSTAESNVPGFMTAFSGRGPVPWAASLTVDAPNVMRSATVIVPVNAGGISVFLSAGGHVIVDFLGYFTGGSAASSGDGLFVPMVPQRMLDTRGGGPLAPGDVLPVMVNGSIVTGNLAMTETFGAGYALAYAAGTKRPAVASVTSTRAGQTVSNMLITRSSSAGMALFAQNGAQFVFDQTGYFTGAAVAVTEPLPCSVSALLVPSCGAWLGASTAPKSGDLDSDGYLRGLGEYEAIAQNTPDILHFYKNGSQSFPTSAERAMSERPGHARSLLLYNWKPSQSLSWRQIADGGADDAIQVVARGLKAYPHKLFLTIWHEPENDMNKGTGRTPADYVAMFRHVVTTLRSLGVTNAVYVMNYMGYYGWSSSVDALYPGDDVVDWIAYDPYGLGGQDSFAELVDTAHGSWPGFYSWATRKAPGKPIMMAEWGYDLTDQPNAADYLDQAVPTLQGRYPALKAMVYWHDDAGNFKVRLDQVSTLGQDYATAYQRLVANAYFNSTSTALAP